MRGHRFSIYDALAASGYFDDNPANTFSRDLTTGASKYTGPVEYPKMLFHPDGEEKISVAAEIVSTPMGPKAVGEQRELLHLIVNNKAEDEKAAGEGWHDHPAKAVRRRVELFIESNPDISEKEKAKLLGAIPSISSDNRIKELERELRRLSAGQSPLLPQVEEPETAAPSGSFANSLNKQKTPPRPAPAPTPNL